MTASTAHPAEVIQLLESGQRHAAEGLAHEAYTQRGLQLEKERHAARSEFESLAAGNVPVITAATEPSISTPLASLLEAEIATAENASTAAAAAAAATEHRQDYQPPAYRCGVCKQVWNVGSTIPHNGIHCGKELEDLTDIPHPLFLAYWPATELPAASSGHATEQPASAEQQWRALHGRIVTLEFAAAVPQIDRIGKQEALRTLQTLCMGPLPTDAHAAFKWWLFVSNLGNKTDRIIGPGIVSAALEDQWDNGVMLLFERQDGTKVKLEIQQPRRGSCSTRIL
jgi:hypothetical protein